MAGLFDPKRLFGRTQAAAPASRSADDFSAGFYSVRAPQALPMRTLAQPSNMTQTQQQPAAQPKQAGLVAQPLIGQVNNKMASAGTGSKWYEQTYDEMIAKVKANRDPYSAEMMKRKAAIHKDMLLFTTEAEARDKWEKAADRARKTGEQPIWADYSVDR